MSCDQYWNVLVILVDAGAVVCSSLRLYSCSLGQSIYSFKNQKKNSVKKDTYQITYGTCSIDPPCWLVCSQRLTSNFTHAPGGCKSPQTLANAI